ncbi:MAG TPA: sugar ABC transporter permease [Candidatus Lumbricidophila sp.]|nr:sugar ABC transporter permease [Candidatus Lumbricidophila sp.]
MRSAPYVLIAPFVVTFAVFTVTPIIVALVSSLFRVSRSGLGFDDGPTVRFAGLENFAMALGDREFLGGFGRVFLFGIVQVPIMLGMSLVFALIIDSALVRWKSGVQVAMFLPFAVPGVVAALLWGFFYQPNVSPVVQLLSSIGIHADFLAPGTVLWSIANVTTWSYLGFNMIVLYSALQAIPRELIEAARIDGASGRRIGLSIKLPLIAPSLFVVLLFSIIGTVQLFSEPTVIQGITSNINSKYTPAMAIFATTAAGNDLNLGSAMAVIVGIVTTVLSVIASRVNRRVERSFS